jgi:predicted RNA-binding Zn-ribbon protein involved in translation (DUF1610 family)
MKLTAKWDPTIPNPNCPECGYRLAIRANTVMYPFLPFWKCEACNLALGLMDKRVKFKKKQCKKRRKK